MHDAFTVFKALPALLFFLLPLSIDFAGFWNSLPIPPIPKMCSMSVNIYCSCIQYPLYTLYCIHCCDITLSIFNIIKYMLKGNCKYCLLVLSLKYHNFQKCKLTFKFLVWSDWQSKNSKIFSSLTWKTEKQQILTFEKLVQVNFCTKKCLTIT